MYLKGETLQEKDNFHFSAQFHLFSYKLLWNKIQIHTTNILLFPIDVYGKLHLLRLLSQEQQLFNFSSSYRLQIFFSGILNVYCIINKLRFKLQKSRFNFTVKIGFNVIQNYIRLVSNIRFENIHTFNIFTYRMDNFSANGNHARHFFFPHLYICNK